MDPSKRGNPPFDPSSYAAGLQRRVERLAAWNKVAKEMARDLLDGDELDRTVAAGWWRQQLDMPQVVLSADEMRAMMTRIEAEQDQAP
jgi:hypothetical protein